jgi:hypothetical protein
VLTTTINGLAIPYTVVAGDTPTTIANKIAASINATSTPDPTLNLPLNSVFMASSVGAVVTITAVNSATTFTLACSLSAGATETYAAGFLVPPSQTAIVTDPLTSGNELTTTINGLAIPYTIAAGDTVATVAGKIAAAINGITSKDPVSGFPLNCVFNASSTAGGVTIKAAGATFMMDCSIKSLGAKMSYTAAGQLPVGSGAGPIAGVWSGYLNAPQDGFYDIEFVTDSGANVTLTIDGTDIPMAAPAGGTAWRNQSPISLTAGALTLFELTVVSVKDTLKVSWESAGVGLQVIPGANLYSKVLIDRLQTAYVRFLKATTLASALKLTANEIAYLAGWFQANSMDNSDKLAPGINVFKPSSMAIIKVGSVLVIDVGAAQETVTVTAITPTTFTATTANPHDGTLTPFPIVSQAAPAIGQGWLNLLPVTGIPDTSVAANLRDVLSGVLDYARIKATLSPKDERLLNVLENPSLKLPNDPNDHSALLSLTRWNPASLNALLTQFFGGSTQISSLAVLENFRRVYDAFAVVKACGISGATLIPATTNDPSATTVSTLQLASRALYAKADWLSVIKPINDTMRDKQRDALVAYVLQQLGDQPETSDINTADKLFEYFLMDVQMEPCMETSRIRHALSSVQLFIERCLRNLEPFVIAPDSWAAEWVWMKRYRVWQANREVFLWPENWLYPELRDDQSPIFKDTMSELLQSDITDDTAAAAFQNYLSKLEEVAKLEPCGIFYHPNDPTDQDNPDEFAHVVARTAGAHRKYYYRRLEFGSWTPWEQIKLDIEDNPVCPVVWNNRLLLFWVRIIKESPLTPPPLVPPPASVPNDPPSPKIDATKAKISDLNVSQLTQGIVNTVQTTVSTPSGSTGLNVPITVKAVLCWSEYYNGKWQPTKTSDVNQPVTIKDYNVSGQGMFDRSLLRLRVGVLPGLPANTLVVDIGKAGEHSTPFGYGNIGFILYNTHSLPVRIEDTAYPAFTQEPSARSMVIPDTYPTKVPNTFSIWYGRAPYNLVSLTNEIIQTSLGERVIQPQPGLPDVWDAPFFYEDSRNVFYVAQSHDFVPFWKHAGYGVLHQQPNLSGVNIPPLALQQRPPIYDPIGPVITPTGPTVIDPATMKQFVAEDANIRSALSSIVAVRYGNQYIGPTGSLADGQLAKE